MYHIAFINVIVYISTAVCMFRLAECRSSHILMLTKFLSFLFCFLDTEV
jgi:hypothetical protein